MAYVTQTEIETAIPAPHLVDALDDNRDGAADTGVLTNVITQASQAVDAYLQGRYTVPFASPEPKAVREAAFCFTGELLYARRGMRGENNPFTDRADFWRERLEKIGNGELPLDAALVQDIPAGAAILETATIDASTR